MTAENEYWPLTLAMWFCAYDSHLSDISARYSARYSQRGDYNLRVKTRNSHGVSKGRPEPVLFEWNPKREVAQYPKTIPILWKLNSVMIFFTSYPQPSQVWRPLLRSKTKEWSFCETTDSWRCCDRQNLLATLHCHVLHMHKNKHIHYTAIKYQFWHQTT